MIRNNFHEKIALILSFLILNNYLFLSLNFSQLLIKINFLIFLVIVFIFYFQNFLSNPFLKIFFLLIVFISLGTPTFEWDPRSIWLFHAKRIFYDKSIFSVLDNYAEFSHNAYPTLAPAFASSLAVLIGYWNEVFPKLSFSLMFLPPFILIYSFLKNTQYLIFLSIVFFIIGKYLFNGWVDGLVAIYFGSSALLMYIIIITDTDFYKKKLFFYLIAFCFFTSLTLIKNEGIALLLILFVTAFLIKLYKSELRKDVSKLFYLSISFLPIILWKFFCYSKGIGYNDYINENILFYLLPRLDDLENYKLISYFLLLNEKFIIALLFFLISFWVKWNKELFNFIFLVFIMYILILFFIFLSTPYDLYWQLDSTAARVVKTLSFLFAFFGLYNLSYQKMGH
ncbi:MAG TPA: hypothetical protein QF874_01600 [Pelagibacteraceae bacterium]|jgi:hypothetical protein|nr:hypothetical protein [Pelagibacteraceae bacterium]|tara:strand:+ start:8478 stop:9665 length:1188 start_codon:yes stop_codon:yes gene_type:complete